MKRWLLSLLLILCVSSPVFAQTSTPTYTPIPALPIPTFDPIASPTPVPTYSDGTLEVTLEALPLNDIYGYLATANANLNSAPDNITSPGQPILPSQNGATLFSYAKWLLSTSTADEVLGPFSGLMVHFGAYIGVVFFLSATYVLIFLVRFLIRFVVWVYNLLPFIH